MDLTYSDEQTLLKDSVERFVRDTYDHDGRRAIFAEPDGFSRTLWAQMAELGWLALPFAEQDGGLGGRPVDSMILMEGLGRGAVVEPVLTSAIMAGSLLRGATQAPDRAALIEGVIDGSKILTVATYERGRRFDLLSVGARAGSDGSGYRLTGEKAVVLHAPVADGIIVPAEASDGLGLFLLDPAGEGVSLRRYKTLDSIPAADLSLDNAGATRLDQPGQAEALLTAMAEETIAALCAEAVGAMDFLLNATVTYTKERVQFGQPISKFQVLRHRMSDMSIAVEEARSMALYVALKLEEGPQERARAVAAAKAKIGKGARFVAQEAVQLHGAMGVTDEMPVGDFFKRLIAFETLFGNTDHHLDHFARAA